ncbi:bifunctional tRNA (5-methylaminomethyl-2-thiouridine)(34)-methyltransferase MnmD/FAD-dependent 5-carboxymethylaminomethyl-2-thiouridine(34) oxidoreductase MnmC [Aliidiomarina taiwanensis]|uniref:tRNA 5-methylaminomethyl-2-thiouridine biosynthesis bifunctional protein MnmC n=2 Tax=Aliidiomarina taiwanensis TaxID=946228 RepID=A0A432X906_9GAMM|nr:bifunctional tRNA (5-methylaminomethyl-2-thiouridine)(34)-methyltransferase MnmD/FAD-dependent 5-carboxymethylaminomethyl-2-thiouridine(34) oxidoreductase MnmC [Aliidiomarina taiwanensis]
MPPENTLSYAELEFDEAGTPQSSRHGDVYFSRGQGAAECRYVFLQHNKLPQRWHKLQPGQHFVIAETGFGTGLNFYITATDFLAEAPQATHLHFVSFEKYPLQPSDLQAAIAHWPEFNDISAATLQHYPELFPGVHRLHIHPRITLDLVFGDVLDTLPDWAKAHASQVDAWYLDGFAPSKNPSMWQPSLYREVYTSLKANGTLATFTATGHVRRGLIQAGICMKKAPGFGHKRDMLYGVKRTFGMPRSRTPNSIAIVGSGIAAACMASELQDYPGSLTLLWSQKAPADGASGNPQAAVYPLLQAQWTRLSEFYSHAFEYARDFYQRKTPQHTHWTGVELYTRSSADAERQQKMLKRQLYPESFLHSSEKGLVMPKAGWLDPVAVVHDLFQQVIAYRTERGLSTRLVTNEPITQITRALYQWQLTTAKQQFKVDHLVLCTGHHTLAYPELEDLPIQPVRGQVTLVKKMEETTLSHVICQKGYALPPQGKVLCTGATFERGSVQTHIDEADDETNLLQLNEMLGSHYTKEHVIGHRASVRATTPDHLPVQGPLVRPKPPGQGVIRLNGVSVLLGLGSRGFTSAPWLAHLNACAILGRPQPAGATLLQATSADRFAKRAVVRSQGKGKD